MSAGPSIIPDAVTPTPTEHEGLVDLGLFSLIHPPVDAKIRTQICNKEYVDMAKLIFTDDVGEMTTITKSSTKTVTQIQKRSTKTISNVLTWSRAFQHYADLYCTRYPHEASDLFRYMSIIQALAGTSASWCLYDEKFRRARAVNALPWGTLHTETYLFCTLAKTSFPPQTPFRPQTQPRFPSYIMRKKGSCWDFQLHSKCSKPNCKLSHTCNNCFDPSHRANRCYKPQRQFKSQSTPTTAIKTNRS